MDKIPEHFVTQFSTNWQHAVQQRESKLESVVTIDTIEGKEKAYNTLEEVEMTKITSRAGVTRVGEQDSKKRYIRPAEYDVVKLYDEWDQDNLGSIVLPTSETVQSQAYACMRTYDRVIIDAALGNAYEGETGTTAVALPNAQLVAVDYVETGTAANSGLTVAKLRQAKYIMDAADLIDPEEERFITVGAKQLQDLLKATELTSGDYNMVKALYEGAINKFVGFTFRICNLLPIVAATGVRTCFAHVRSGLILGRGEKKVKMDIRADRSHALQIRSAMRLGAVRRMEEKVVGIYCDEVL